MSYGRADSVNHMEKEAYMRTTLLIVIILTGITTLNAASVGLNPVIGINYAWYDEYPILLPNTGLDIPVTFDRHEFRTGLHYSPKGHRYDRDFSYAYWLHYAEVPMTYAYYPSIFVKKLGFCIGYSIAYLFSASIEDEDGLKASTSLKSMYKAVDHGGIIGLRYNQPMGISILSLSVNYYHGIGTVRAQWDDIIDPKRNHSITALVGFAFPLPNR